ncbi:hypothetical protein J3458_009202 [Metarhizium acridum]|nr:hypothetical protein J3458_009202 [Metarhizium acridum]
MKSKRAREAATASEDFLPVDDTPVEKKRKRSDDEHTEVKQKKAKKDKKDKKDRKKDKKESRKEKKDKRKDLQDLPEEEKEEEEDAAAKDDAVVSQAPDVSDEKKSKKKEKKEKKRRRSKEAANGDAGDEPKKEKKDKKEKSKDEDAPTQETPAPGGASDDAGGAPDAKSSRHIVFVGNLPFTATADSIKAHFASLKPISVRCMKNKDDDKPCRGIAFVEFANVWTMRTCLDKFHHTEFEGRRINVELT